MTLAFAARYRVAPVLLGIALAAGVVMAISVLVGAAVGDVLLVDGLT